MTLQDQQAVARARVADGKGILAADETLSTMTKPGSHTYDNTYMQ